MKQMSFGLAWASVAAVVWAFFLPWARLDLREPGIAKPLREAPGMGDAVGKLTDGLGRLTATIRRGAETVTGDLPQVGKIPKEVSGVQIPRLANQEDAKVAIALVELFLNERQHLGLKSYAVYLLPGLGLLGALLLTCFGRHRGLVLGVAVLFALAAVGGFWKLSTAKTDALFIAITIGPGLWLSLWAYVGLAAAAGLRALPIAGGGT